MKKINDLLDKLNNIERSIVNDILPYVENAAENIRSDDTIDEVLYEIAYDFVYDYILNDKEGKIRDAVNTLSKIVFLGMASGTEFEKYEGFVYRIEEVFDIGEFYFDVRISKDLDVEVEVYEDTLGSIRDWASAILSARKLLRRPPNEKYVNNRGYQKILPLLRSHYWRNIVYPNQEFDTTEELRLSFLPEDSAAFIFALESGTGGVLETLVGEGGFPTPIYSSKGTFTELFRNRIETFLSSIVGNIFRESYDMLQRSIEMLKKYGVEVTDKLSTAVKKLSYKETVEMIEKGKKANINESIGVIINIEGKYYDVIKTKAGRLGVRYSFALNKRKRI